jgi:hypothetical protein
MLPVMKEITRIRSDCPTTSGHAIILNMKLELWEIPYRESHSKKTISHFRVLNFKYT